MSVPSLNKNSTGHNIAGLFIEEFLNFGISWKNCIGITTDNANVMIGTTNGVMGYLIEQQPELINIGCPCHLVNLAAEKGAKTLSVSIDLLISIWFYLEKSKKRKRKLQEFQMLCDGETFKILKHVCT